LRIVPILFPLITKFSSIRRLMFRTVSQTAVSYRGSPLSEGRAGGVHGGDRLPWVKVDANGTGPDNFTPLTSLDWQVHVYGDAATAIQELCRVRQLALHVFPWREEMGRAGLCRDTVYLVRPDGYIGMADSSGATAIASYLDARKITANTAM
jgi:hypothetical protein